MNIIDELLQLYNAVDKDSTHSGETVTIPLSQMPDPSGRSFSQIKEAKGKLKECVDKLNDNKLNDILKIAADEGQFLQFLCMCVYYLTTWVEIILRC